MVTQVKGFMSWFRRSNSGFTFIELLIAATVGIVLLTSSIVAYNAFLNRQTSIQSAQAVRSLLQQAQTRARNGDKAISSCTTLNGYQVSGTVNTGTYALSIVCNGSATNLDTFTLLEGEVFTASFTVIYPVLPGPISATTTTIGIKKAVTVGNTPRYEFTVNTQGVVEEGEYIEEEGRS